MIIGEPFHSVLERSDGLRTARSVASISGGLAQSLYVFVAHCAAETDVLMAMAVQEATRHELHCYLFHGFCDDSSS